MYNIPYATGYSPSRYQFGTDAMLLKASKSRRIEKLRTIILYGAEFNFMNKILGRDMLANAESNNSLAPELFGSRKTKSAIELAVCKRLTLDITRQNNIQPHYVVMMQSVVMIALSMLLPQYQCKGQAFLWNQ